MKKNVLKTVKLFTLLFTILLFNVFLAQQKKDKDYVGHVTLLRKNGLNEKVMVPEFKIYSIEIKCIKTKNNFGKKVVTVKSDAGTRTYWNNIVLEIKNNAGNNSSSIYKMTVKKNTLLFLGDLGIEGGEELLSLNKSSIKNMDYVQMAHHGQAGVSKDVYKIINPKYCMWPTTDWLWKNKDGIYKTDETKKWMQSLHVDKNYVANKGTVQIKLKNTK